MRSDLRSVSSISGRLADGFPEELLAVFFRLGEVLFLRDDAEAGDGVGDRNLPDPGVRDRQEVDVDVVEVRVAFGENLAIVAIKPGVDGVLIETVSLIFSLSWLPRKVWRPLQSTTILQLTLISFGPMMKWTSGCCGPKSTRLQLSRRHRRLRPVCARAAAASGRTCRDRRGRCSCGLPCLPAGARRNGCRRCNPATRPSRSCTYPGFLIVGGPDRAELVRKFRFFHLRKEAEIFEYAGGRWNQRLADVRAGKQFAFEHHALHASLGQIARHARSGRAAADNGYIKIRCCLCNIH